MDEAGTTERLALSYCIYNHIIYPRLLSDVAVWPHDRRIFLCLSQRLLGGWWKDGQTDGPRLNSVFADTNMTTDGHNLLFVTRIGVVASWSWGYSTIQHDTTLCVYFYISLVAT